MEFKCLGPSGCNLSAWERNDWYWITLQMRIFWLLFDFLCEESSPCSGLQSSLGCAAPSLSPLRLSLLLSSSLLAFLWCLHLSCMFLPLGTCTCSLPVAFFPVVCGDLLPYLLWGGVIASPSQWDWPDRLCKAPNISPILPTPFFPVSPQHHECCLLNICLSPKDDRLL